MEVAHLITSLPPWILFVLIFAFCELAAEAGSLVARKRITKGIKEPGTPIGTAVGAMLGLLAFMLAFTFSITSSRFSDRKALVITQANAIGTCYLRTSLIPEKQKREIRKLFREYVEILVREQHEATVEKAVVRLDKIHLLIWEQTVSLDQTDLHPAIKALFVTSVNQVIDIAGERKTVALVFRVPGTIWISLLLLAALSMFSIGYQTGTFGARRILDMPLLAAAFALVIVMIADMDSSGPHRFKVSQQPMKDVQQMIQEDIP